MHSKQLRQVLEITLDTMGMEGPVTTRAVAIRTRSDAPRAYWAVGDNVDAELLYLQREAKICMKASISSAMVENILKSGRVPKELRGAVSKLTKWICISARGGAGAEHVMSWLATREQWEANYQLKAYVTEMARQSRDAARDIRDLLKTTGADNLMALIKSAPVIDHPPKDH